MSVTVNMNETPTFTQVSPICAGGSFTLPGTSDNGIMGSWSPAINTSMTTQYTFTPNDPAHPCAVTALMTVTVNMNETPTFTQVGPICAGGSFTLPGTSDNGIMGSWSPAINTNMTTQYTFTPNDPAHPCAVPAMMTVTVNNIVTTNFTQLPAICQGGSFTLPTTSTNGISGTWSPAENNQTTTMYTFAPNPGQCGTSATMTVTVNVPTVPALTPAGPFCTAGGVFALNTTQSGINGTWSGTGVTGNQFNPATAGPGTFTLTFTPGPNQCALPGTINVTVSSSPTGNLSGSPVLCPGQCGQVTFQLSGGSGTYNLDMSIAAGPLFNLPFTIIGATTSTVLTLCLNNGTPYDAATNTVNIPTFVPAGTYSLSLLGITATSGLCQNGTVGSPGTLSVIITTAPPASNASLSLCDLDQNGSEIFDLTSVDNIVKNNIAVNTVSWFTNMAATNPIATPGAFSSGNNTVYAQVTSSNGCTNVVPVTLILQVPEVLSFSDFASCVNGPLISLPGSISGNAGSWSGSGVTGGGTQFNPAGFAQGSYPITFTPNPGLCALPVTVNVVISTAGPVPLPSPIATTCLGESTYTLSNNQGGVTGVWSGSPFLSGNVFNITATGTFTLTFTPTGSSTCFSANTTNIIVAPNTTLTPVTFPNQCSTGSAILDLGNTVGGETGTWSGNNQVVNNTFNPSAPSGIYPLIFTPFDPCFNPMTTSIEVIPLATLTPPALGPTCVSSPPIVLPTTVSGFSGTWTLGGGPITVFNPMTTGVGSYTLTFTVNPGSCALPLNVTIVVSSFNAGANSAQSLCITGAQMVDLNTYLSPGHTIGGIWKLNNTNVPNPSAYDLNTLAVGSSVFNYILSDPACGQDTAKITFNISKPNNAGNNNTLALCEGNISTVSFSALIGQADGGGTWTIPAGTAVDLSDLTKVNLSGLAAGSYNFSYIIAADGCPADTSTLGITIAPFISAGTDGNSTLCLGSTVDLISLVNTTNTGGTIVNINNVSGLTGTMWNTTGLAAGNYSFAYKVTNQSPCKADTAYLNITLAASVTAGSDQTGAKYCEGETIMLSDYLSSGASSGGSYYLNGVLVPNGIFITGAPSTYIFTYVVGDGITCPKDEAILTLTKTPKPNLMLSPVTDICENDCTSFNLNNTAGSGSVVYLSVIGSGGQVYKKSVTIPATGSPMQTLCAKATGPFDFKNLPLGINYSIKIDSLVLTGTGCTFDYNQTLTFTTKPLPKRQISKSLCKGDVLIIGSDVYSETKPTGTTIVASQNATQCDSLISVNLTFNNPSSTTNINTTTCDQNLTIKVGTTTFNKSNPKGQVLLKNKAGCDSLVSVDLKFSTFSTGNFVNKTCDTTATFTVGSQTFSKAKPAGSVTLTGASVFGCDSIVSVSITYLNTPVFKINTVTCDDTYKVAVGNVTFNKSNPTGMVKLPGQAINGCDSLVSVNLSFVPGQMSNYTYATCASSYTYKVGNQVFSRTNPSGQVVLSGASSNGCDSIVNVQLNFSEFSFSQILGYKCDGTEPELIINLASHPGPYEFFIDGNKVPGATSLPFKSNISKGNHNLVVATAEGCRDTLAVNVLDSQGPVVTLSQVPLTDDQVQITTTAPPNVLYNLQWNPSSTLSCSDCYNPVASPTETTTYILSYMYGNDCTDQKQITIEAVNKPEVIIPNIFSPNGDGANDAFYVQLPGEAKATVKTMRIYDRWGNLVFLEKDKPANVPADGWQGLFDSKEVVPGVFVFLIELQLEGKSTTDSYSGSVTLIR